ncbi:Stringent starvation protein B [Candidatus Kinetoplastibacterium sorsogonicusi]|uniref:Stringent starvation protein B n=1 Tax=Candidatus Kinetoplastidibacterium kentomonadis TaxID=1576550 RepID=A0A3S7J906_9PROT|nr:ClpXP protease specificity-enhancing factor SspB [Candidatus Kinetoplastibacterium sorsogonicusi]AWD32159.1 Stringent starvation protein B [Candidatus Kinetoplastibacterium sorsogonicusi]
MKYTTKPYLIRAIYNWCIDNKYLPYILVYIDENLQIPLYLKNQDSIVFNIDPEAVYNLEINNHFINFEARFNGNKELLSINIDNIISIYAYENQIGLHFDIESSAKANNIENKSIKNKTKLRLVD